MTSKDNFDALLRLLTWMSPAFPLGTFSYSGGLEMAVADRRVTNASELKHWISMLLGRGTFWNDAVLFSQAWNGHQNADVLGELAELAQALAGSAERYRETVLLGDAFKEAAFAWPSDVLVRLPKHTPYPVAVGAIAAANGIALRDALAAFLHASVSQFVSAGIRLGVAGQKDGVAILASLETEITAAADRAVGSSLDDLGSATIVADTAAMRHETLETRLFRS